MSCVQFSKAVQLSLLALLWKWNLCSLQIKKTQQKRAWFGAFFYCAKNEMGEEQRDEIHFIEFYFL